MSSVPSTGNDQPLPDNRKDNAGLRLVTFEPLAISLGSIDRNAIIGYLRSHQPALVACYEKGLQQNPLLKGRVILDITLSLDGKVSKVAIAEDSLKGNGVSSCVTSVVRTWAFPFTAESQVSIAVPLIFSPPRRSK